MTGSSRSYTGYKEPVKYTTTGPITLSGTGDQANGDWNSGSSLPLAAGDRVLVKNQADQKQNGIYVAASGAWSRAVDSDQTYELVPGTVAVVAKGVTLPGTLWVLQSSDSPVIIGTSQVSFNLVSGGGGALNLNDLNDVDTSGVADGSLLRYESTGSTWADTTSATLLLDDNGQLQIPTTGASAGILLGGDAQLYRGGANIITVGSGDKIQQAEVPTVGDDLTNKTYVDGRNLDNLNDVDTAGVVDGSLLRYESTGSTWQDTTSSTLLLDDNGQLQVPTTGSSAGILLGGDAQLYRGGANIITVGTGDKIQQASAPTVANDLTNKTYVDDNVGVHPALVFQATGYIQGGQSSGAKILGQGDVSNPSVSPASDMKMAPVLYWTNSAFGTNYTQQILIIYTLQTNSTDPNTGVSMYLAAIDANGGGTEIVTGSTGATVAGSSLSFSNSTLAAGVMRTGNTGWFSAPTADFYALFINPTSALATNSVIRASAFVYSRYI